MNVAEPVPPASRIILDDAGVAGLERALAAAGLIGKEREDEWDSLDIVTILAVVEDHLGVALPPSLQLQRLRGLDDVVRLIHEVGVRSERAVLRLEMPSRGYEWSARAVRHAEYRLALAHPGSTISLTTGDRVVLRISAESELSLPIPHEIFDALGLSSRPEARVTYASSGIDVTPASLQPTEQRKAVSKAIATMTAGVVGLGGTVRPPTPATISLEALRLAGYYDAHPEQLILFSESQALLPAACLHVYDGFFDEDETLITFTQPVFRREMAYSANLGRLPSFLVQEVVWKSRSADEDAETADAIGHLVESIAAEAGLETTWQEADDPFFVAHPTDATSKRELVGRVGGRPVSLASVNRHGGHYSSRFSHDRAIVSGCAGLGLDRLALAVAERHYAQEERR